VTLRIPLETQFVDPSSGEHQGAAFAALNPSRAVPLLVDGGFRLSECSAMLKYVAERTAPAGALRHQEMRRP
jgi:glutathione S-transferase